MSTRPIFFQEAERPVRRQPRSKRWIGALVIGIIAFVFALVLAEGLARILWGRTLVLFPRYHEEVNYGRYTLRRLVPETRFRHASADGSWTFSTNAQGFRDSHTYVYDKSPGVRRVLCLGDGSTQGLEGRQEQIFPSVMQRRLQRLGHRVEVLNTGVSGFGTAEQLAFLESEGLRYSPDVVLLAWSFDDFQDNAEANLFRLKEGNLVQEKFEYIPDLATQKAVRSMPPLRWASQYSYFYSLLFDSVGEARRILQAQNPSANAGTGSGFVIHHGVAVPRSQIELGVALIKRLHAGCKARGAKLVILDVPWLPQDKSDFASSIPDSVLEEFASSSDALLRSQEVLDSYRGVTDIFVPHGQNHISETSHLLLGMSAAGAISSWWQQSATP